MIEQLELTNLLSFGTQTQPITLNSGLNVLIGPNGSGKSNLIEAISLLQAMPKDLTKPIRDGGGIKRWLWQGHQEVPEATLQAVITNVPDQMSLKHTLCFTESAQRLEIRDEIIENIRPYPGHLEPYFYYKYQNGHPVLNVRDKIHDNFFERRLRAQDVDIQQSIVAQRTDPDQYPEIDYLIQRYRSIRIYRDWQFGRYTRPRLAQSTDLPNVYLEENLCNLGLVLNWLRRDLSLKKRLLTLIQDLYEGIEDIDLQIESGTVQIFFVEADLQFPIPATRLSDGTLRFLCLLTILLHPKPPPLICIEEPELGLHPDVLPTLVDLLIEASNRTQLIVTTHSVDLINDLTDTPEAVLVCEKHHGVTQIKQLDAAELAIWLKKYHLGQLWQKGILGGQRW